MALGLLLQDGSNGGGGGTSGKYITGTANKNGANPVAITCGFRPNWVIIADLSSGGNMYAYKDGDTLMHNCSYGATYNDTDVTAKVITNDNGFTYTSPNSVGGPYFRYWAFGGVKPIS